MPSAELEALVQTGLLTREPPRRSEGYRTHRRYLVFQALPHTLGLATPTWRVLAKAHDVRNRAEYEGAADVDLALLAGLIEAGKELRDRAAALPLPPAAQS